MRAVRCPFSEADVRAMKLGEVVALSGPVVSGRDEVHIRALKYIDEGKPVPNCLEGAVLFHCGPIMRRLDGGSWSPIAAGPTTSARMNSLEPRFIREFGIRAIIGKGGMSQEVVDAMREVGCVYLAATGGAAVSLAEQLSNASGVEWEDLGMAEAMWKFEASNLGPLVVAIDAGGNSLYEEVRKKLHHGGFTA